MTSISSFENTSVYPDTKLFFWIAASVADAAAVNTNGTKTLLTNGVSIFFINGEPTDVNGLQNLRNHPC